MVGEEVRMRGNHGSRSMVRKGSAFGPGESATVAPRSLKRCGVKAVQDQGHPSDRELWLDEPPAEEAHDERLRRIRFLRKHHKIPQAQRVANYLADCSPADRCMSGACPECGRLLQRLFVRES